MRIILTVLLLTVIINISNAKGKEYIISGHVTNSETGKLLFHAHIFNPTNGLGSLTNKHGFFNIATVKGAITLKVTFTGYKSRIINLDIKNDTVVQIKLSSNIILDEIDVKPTNSFSELNNIQMSQFSLPLKEIYLLPSFLGETDIVKSVQLTPGVQSGSEGSLGFYVRGGGPDQNLVLLNGIPLYGINHMFGMYSVFNSDIVSSVSLYKGGFPARFGGRLSSVLDIQLKEGNLNKYHGNISTGLIFSKFNLEGPLKKGKIGFNISARRTYADLVYKLFKNKNAPSKNNGLAYFYDVSAQITIKLSEKSKLLFNAFSAVDNAKATITDKYSIDNKPWEEYTNVQMFWANYVFSAKWNHYINEKLFLKSIVAFSNYKFDINHNYHIINSADKRLNTFNFDYNSDIKDLLFGINFNYEPSKKHSIKFGANFTKQSNNPGVKAVDSQEDATIIDYKVKEKQIMPLKGFIFFEDHWSITEELKANLGFHISGYHVENEWYSSIEPRISLKYLISDRLSIKSSFAKMNQYIHLLTTTTIRSPIDLWVPATPKIKPQKSIQLAFGVVYSLSNSVEFSFESFYKKLNGVIEYKDGATFLGSAEGWEDKIEQGEGWSYGTELLLRKTTGKTTGWLGYTLSWSERKFEEINFGNKFPFRYDQRHDISFVVVHKLSKNIDAGLTWVYGSGNAVTLQTQKFLSKDNPYSIDNNNEINYFNSRNNYRMGVVNYFKSRNNYRMPAYHRMDISINFHKEKKHGTRTWKLGLYNTYNHQNPFFLYYGYAEAENKTNSLYNSNKVLKQFSLLPILPSLSYSYKF